jgi:hypothetical protein
MQDFDSFQLNEQTVVHEEVEAQRFVKNKPFILHANYFLRCSRNRTQFQLAQQTSFVNRFNQSWSLTSMDLDGRSNDFATDAVCSLIKRVHYTAFLQKAAKKTKIQFWLLINPFVAFVSFC